MKILLLNDHADVGGAAIAARRLADALTSVGNEVLFVSAFPTESRPHGSANVRGSRLLGRAERRLGRGSSTYVNRAFVHGRIRRLIKRQEPDWINIHNLHGATEEGWGLGLVRLCARLKPTVWTLHDMWSYTGSCAYSYDSTQFLRGCNESCSCPSDYPRRPPHLLRREWSDRAALMQEPLNLSGVAPSRWMQTTATQGLWKYRQVHHIPNGVATDVFRPRPQRDARRRLGVGEGPVVLLAAADVDLRRKGGDLLLPTLAQIHKKVTLLVVGEGGRQLRGTPHNVVSLGMVNDVSHLVDAYNAADVLLHPARVDNLPNTLLESLACGTPVVAFDIGGVSDIVRPTETGWLANSLEATSLSRVLDDALDELAGGSDLRDKCRAVAEEEFTLPLQAKRYEKMAERVLTS